MIWQGRQLQEALNVYVEPSIKAEKIQFNSKDVERDDIFIALKGENGDGHDYIQEALDQGASVIIVSKEVVNIPKDKIIKVPDTIKALGQLAQYKRANSKAKFIGITGSSGKTSTKEALKVMLSAFGKVFASRGNFNNELGVPINLASMPGDTEYAIIEIGMNQPGEIKMITKMVQPDIAVITSIAEAHIEFFKNIGEIVNSKCEIFEGLDTKTGIAVIPRDNEHYPSIVSKLSKLQVKNIYSFGKNKEAQSCLKLYEPTGDKVYLKFNIEGTNLEIYRSPIAEHFALNFAACLMVASLLKCDLQMALEQLPKIELMVGRGKIIDATKAQKKFRVICDYYNANPGSLKASLTYLKQISHPNKIAIIGDMRELGDAAPELHRSLVPYIIDSGVSRVFLVGSNIEYIAESLKDTAIEVKVFEDVLGLLKIMDKFLYGDELILIKGSRGVRLDRVMEYFDNIN